MDTIGQGPNPAVRLQNCQALFAANPGYGDLATFQDPAENTSLALISSGGNLNLKNEISNTWTRSEEHTSELQSLMRISYAVFCLKKKKINNNQSQASNT